MNRLQSARRSVIAIRTLSDKRSSADTVLTAPQAVEIAAGSLRGSLDGFLNKIAM
ncbi:MAG TPA: hypothetical protein VKG05_14945 [Steroidobacteraceae bacterium]|nr:hypothetical protein [Steroidobacteraceae bacterium]